MERNWAGNHAYGARALHRPGSLEEVRELAASRPRIRVLGTRHSFTAIADSDELMSLERLPADVAVDRGRGTVAFAAGLRYGDLAGALEPHGLALARVRRRGGRAVRAVLAAAAAATGERQREQQDRERPRHRGMFAAGARMDQR